MDLKSIPNIPMLLPNKTSSAKQPPVGQTSGMRPAYGRSSASEFNNHAPVGRTPAPSALPTPNHQPNEAQYPCHN